MSIFRKNSPIKEVLESLHKCLGVKNIVREDRVVCPGWNLTIRPEIEQTNGQMIILNFYVTSLDWNEELYECCAAGAIGSGVGSFLFAFWDGIRRMMERDNPIKFETEFAGKAHKWDAYVSQIVGLGENVKNFELKDYHSFYYDLISEEVKKRLGNQDMCYVKVYAAKTIEEVTGEVRINDIKSEELSAVIAEAIKDWDVDRFASHKQFFFIKQDKSTLLPYPYSGDEGYIRFKSKIKKAVELFSKCTDEEYSNFCEKLREELGDTTLAEECYSFLPEICAENAFSDIRYSEKVELSIGSGDRIGVYKNQLADYYPMMKALFSLFDEGVFGKETNDIYKLYIGCSAIYNVVNQLLEKGSDLKNCGLTSLLFSVSEDFKLR